MTERIPIFGAKWQEQARREAEMAMLADRIRFGEPVTMQPKGNEMTDDSTWKIKQNRGPTIEFEGRLLASTEWETRDGQMRLELYQTRGGALIPVTRTDFEDGRRSLVSASVVEPDPNVREASREADMRFAVLSHFDWNDRAKSMVRQQLGWKLTQVVE